MSRYILDACALLALLRNESGADIVAAALNAAVNGEAEIIMNKVNILEVYYDLYRTLGKDKAAEILTESNSLRSGNRSGDWTPADSAATRRLR